jgi:hypothetical protein
MRLWPWTCSTKTLVNVHKTAQPYIPEWQWSSQSLPRKSCIFLTIHFDFANSNWDHTLFKKSENLLNFNGFCTFLLNNYPSLWFNHEVYKVQIYYIAKYSKRNTMLIKFFKTFNSFSYWCNKFSECLFQNKYVVIGTCREHFPSILHVELLKI